MRKLYLVFLFLSPVIYAQILFLLNWVNEELGLKKSEALFFNGPLNVFDVIAIVFAFMSLGIICITYGSILPMGWKLYNPENPDETFFPGFFSAIAFGMILALFGLLIGIIEWIYTGIAEWYLFMPFLVVGEGDGVFNIYIRISSAISPYKERNPKMNLVGYILF